MIMVHKVEIGKRSKPDFKNYTPGPLGNEDDLYLIYYDTD